jgi:hypothetical protein
LGASCRRGGLECLPSPAFSTLVVAGVEAVTAQQVEQHEGMPGRRGVHRYRPPCPPLRSAEVLTSGSSPGMGRRTVVAPQARAACKTARPSRCGAGGEREVSGLRSQREAGLDVPQCQPDRLEGHRAGGFGNGSSPRRRRDHRGRDGLGMAWRVARAGTSRSAVSSTAPGFARGLSCPQERL